MKKCKYATIYNDLEEGGIFKRWACEERADNSSIFCTFHNKIKTQWDDKTCASLQIREDETSLAFII
jgi:hypothetical protein